MVVFVTLHEYNQISLKFPNVKEKKKFSRDLFSAGVFFFTGIDFRKLTKNPRNSRKFDSKKLTTLLDNLKVTNIELEQTVEQ